jgi:DNA invertase Pin-like site-specific DNA recombinase
MQIEKCQYKLEGESYREYRDEGYSGKNNERPDLQRLINDIEAGEIGTVVVYKLDRISRSVVDFVNLLEVFKKHEVEFISCDEKFDTSGPFGEILLLITVAFAEMERKNIQQRIKDAYHSGIPKGYRMGGGTPYGFRLEPCVIQGKKTTRLDPIPEQVAFVKQMFEMYAEPQTSLRDVMRVLTEQGIKSYTGKTMMSASLAQILRNPVYVMADLDIYDFYKSQGTVIVNDVQDYGGTNGCYYYKGKDKKGNKHTDLQGNTLVIAPHGGFIPSDLWLKVRKKLITGNTYQPARKAKNTWLGGKVKCGNCTYALKVGSAYCLCSLRADVKSNCIGCGTIKTEDLHQFIYDEMVKKLNKYKTLMNRKNSPKTNPKLNAKQIELAGVESEIETVLENLSTANATLKSYANEKIEKLHLQRQALMREIATLTLDTIPAKQINEISNYLDTWDDVSFEDKKKVADSLIKLIFATSASIEIQWKF